ncbi:TetR/AcrR family transcriptional regulator [Novosphingobium sp.]|uniref:TetR/AcrR family transcriptional regulator n=1 Tax=Novosphingobium sp. TaxID=1874826 RepID=UPI00262427C9|nr:TetR/AcrR family transcriptional regulator [Novosphingobium sp.]
MDQALENAANCSDRAGIRRRKIIASARQLFLQKGFHATGVAQIAKDSGVAVGQLYRDFSCKEEIIAAIVHNDCSDFLEAESLQKHIETGQKDLIWAWIAEFLNPADTEADPMLSEILAEAGRNERVSEIFRKLHNEVLSTMLRALEALIPGTVLEDQRFRLANLIVTLSLGFIQTRSVQSQGQPSKTCELAMEMLRSEVLALQRHANARVVTE